MNNLKALTWHKSSKVWTAYGAGICYTITGFDGVINVTINNLNKQSKGEPRSSDSKTFTSYSAALEFVEHEHYPHFMSEFVKPMPTWIDVNERLPEDDGKYLVATSCGKQWVGNYNLPPKPNEWMLNGWSMNGGWHPFDITHWMPIPEFNTMQNLHKGGSCE